jgi:hypothetical protein
MKVLLTLTSLFLLAALSSAYAAPKAERAEEDPEFEVLVDPTAYDPKAFARPGVKVTTMARGKNPHVIPDKKTREAAFQKVPGLEDAIKGYDNLSRDILYVQARSQPLEELRKKHPQIPADLLAKLAAAVK